MTPEARSTRMGRALVLVALVLSACASAPTRTVVLRGLDGQSCVVGGEAVPHQVVEVSAPALLDAALGRTGEGRICAGRVYRLREPLRIYRVWDAAKQNTYGEWWALSPPRGDREEYRREYAVCPEWNALDHLAACTLRAGARVVLGPGQSATCADRTYARSPSTQVFIQGRTDEIRAQVDACELTPWP